LLLVAFLLVNGLNCHLSLVLASVVQGDAVNCNIIPCLCSLPTEPSPEGLQLGDYVCAEGTNILKFDKKSTDL